MLTMATNYSKTKLRLINTRKRLKRCFICRRSLPHIYHDKKKHYSRRPLTLRVNVKSWSPSSSRSHVNVSLLSYCARGLCVWLWCTQRKMDMQALAEEYARRTKATEDAEKAWVRDALCCAPESSCWDGLRGGCMRSCTCCDEKRYLHRERQVARRILLCIACPFMMYSVLHSILAWP